MSKPLLATASAVAIGLLAATADAASLKQVDAYALTVDGKLVPVDLTARAAGKPMTVKGTQGRIVGIDVRPADGMLYAVTSGSVIHTIDPKAGMVVKSTALAQPFMGTAPVTVDFNPAADRLRLMGANGVSFRVHPDTGAVIVDGSHRYDPAGPDAAATPMIIAGAYTNSVAGTKETALYTIDARVGQLAVQAPPNDGVQKAKGPLGVKVTAAAFDIRTGTGGANTAFLIADGLLMEIDLATGKATPKGRVDGLPAIVDLAVVPAAGTVSASAAPARS
jgi:hypothetical protein